MRICKTGSLQHDEMGSLFNLALTDWWETRGLFSLAGMRPIHVAAFVEGLQRTHSKPTVKQHLAALRMLFDWHVVDPCT